MQTFSTPPKPTISKEKMLKRITNEEHMKKKAKKNYTQIIFSRKNAILGLKRLSPISNDIERRSLNQSLFGDFQGLL